MKAPFLITSVIAFALAIGSAQAQNQPAPPPPGNQGPESGFNPEGSRPPHKGDRQKPRGPHGPHEKFGKDKTMFNAHIKGEHINIVCKENRSFEECLAIFTDAVQKIGKK